MSRLNLCKVPLCVFALLLFPRLFFAQALVINEFMASNSTTIANESGDYVDWVEIYNPGNQAIDLAGMYLTDDLSTPDLHQIPTGFSDSTTIQPKGFKLFWFDKHPDAGPLHVNAKLKTGGEQIGLFNSNLTVIDSLSYGQQTPDISYGRIADDSTEWTFFSQPTPGQANYTPLPIAQAPLFTYHDGIFSHPISLTLLTTTPGTNIYYTTDGSLPTNASTLYTAPIMVDSSMSIRAITAGPNNSPSPVSTHMYLINRHHTFPIVYLTFDPVDFYDSITGIYVNYLENWERPANLAFFEMDGSLAFSQPAEVEIQGTGSAEFAHKSIAIKAKSYQGEKQFQYPIFPQLPYQKYGSFTLRNSGQDWDKTIFRDAYATSFVADLSDIGDIISPPRLYLQSYRPTIAYFNGEYRGIYNIRERLDHRYIKTHFGLSKGEYDYLKGVDEVKNGDWDSWFQFMDFLLAHDMNQQSHFDSLQKVMDVQDYLDYITFNIFLNNTDWPANNNRRWKAKSPDGKWRWMVFDLDYTLSLYNEDGSWNTGDYHDNALLRLYNDTGWQWPNPEWATRPFRACVQNTGWRHQFINRMADQLNTLFTPERLQQRLDEFVNRYRPEMAAHQCKWFECFDGWDDNIGKVRHFISGRAGAVRQHFVEQYAEITDTTIVHLSANPKQGGTIEWNTLTLKPEHFPWQGIYFAGIDIPVKATPAPGYEFVGWSDSSLGSNPNGTINLSSDEYTLTAIFQPIVSTRLAPKETLTIFPNPAKEHLLIKTDSFAGKAATIQVLDLSGRIVFYQEVAHLPGENYPIPIKHFPKGNYVLKVQPNNHRIMITQFTKVD